MALGLRHGRLGSAAAIAALAVLALAAPRAGAAIKLKAANGPVLASFSSLQCKVAGSKGFTATGRSNGWRLTIRIYAFEGYKRYPIEYGAEGPADFFVGRGSNSDYSNIIKPDIGAGPEGPFQLTQGGAVAFPGGRGTLGIGFALAFKFRDYTQQASLSGRAPCRYQRR